MCMSKQVRVSDDVYELVEQYGKENRRSVNNAFDFLTVKIVESLKKLDSQKLEKSSAHFEIKDGEVNQLNSTEPAYTEGPLNSEATPQKVTTSELGELPCCAGKRPCKHWAWDSSTGEGFINSLSGRMRSVE